MFIFVAVIMLSCTVDNESSDLANILAELDSRMAAWEALGIDAYQFTAQSSNYRPTIPVTVTVLPGVEPALTYDIEKMHSNLGQMEDVLHGRPFSPFNGLTIDELFVSIRDHAISRNTFRGRIFVIRYNQEYHYPEEYFVRIPPPRAPGLRGGGLVITDFQVLDASGEE